MFALRRIAKLFRFYSSVSKQMIEEKIIPDVLDMVPKEKVVVYFGSGARADLGNELTPSEVKHVPHVRWVANAGGFYIVSMVDPDAPSREKPEFREWLYWLVGNIPEVYISSGCTIAEYLGSGPPKDTGLHRYIILVYKQRNKIVFEEPFLSDTSPEGRGKFSIGKFARKYEMGEPIAGNFFLAQYDDYVPLFYKKLGVHV